MERNSREPESLRLSSRRRAKTRAAGPTCGREPRAGAGASCTARLRESARRKASATGIELELELKTDARGDPYPGLVESTARMVEARGMVGRVRLTCFVPEILEEIRSRAGGFRRLASLDRRSSEMLGGLDRAIRRFLDLDCTIAVERTLLELEIERCRAAIGTERLGVWVPNTPGELNYWLRQPVGQITSDRPDIALGLRRQITAGAASS